MKKILAIGDVHGRNEWKKIVNEADWDICVFVGDYFDSWDLEGDVQIKNFEDIIAFKKKSEKPVFLLTGNHDLHYLLNDEIYSGYQDDYAVLINLALTENIDHLQIAYENHGLLFTHAGLTETLAAEHNVDRGGVAEFLNTLPLTAFKFSRKEPYDPSGDAKHQGPMWVRPKSLKKDAYGGYIHIVGHTQNKEITQLSDTIKLIDCPGSYMIIKINDGMYEYDICNVGV
jgi:predicted MPP superfamily phosphohydrolase